MRISSGLRGAVFATFSTVSALHAFAADGVQDAGRVASNTTVSVRVALKQKDVEGLKKLIEALHTPGNPLFHQFLTPEEFHRRFDPDRRDVEAATAYFTRAGLSVQHDRGQLLQVSGSAQAIEEAFGVSLHEYAAPAVGGKAAHRFHAPTADPKLKSEAVEAGIEGLVGLDNRPSYHPNKLQRSPLGQNAVRANAGAGIAGAGNAFQEWTVADVARQYNVEPLYASGIRGEGKTIGIVTLASFTPSDAFRYWNRVGLQVDPNRITVVQVDGGAGPITDNSSETTLDVQQAGGLAPAAKIVVYEAPIDARTGFIDAFYKAVNDNVADTISVSWGSFEAAVAEASQRIGGSKISDMKLQNQIFMQAAAQGQTIIAAQGDSGSYEANRGLPLPQYSELVSVQMPGSSPYVTSAGGTTLPSTLVFNSGVTVTIPTEQAWGWSYLAPVCAARKLDLKTTCGIWSEGSGGGVSAYFKRPSYQKAIPGIALTATGQKLTDNSTNPPEDLLDLRGGFAGRNVPDVSLNADPNTGYAVDFTDQNGAFSISYGNGGTSFVAPQLAGIAALLGQRVGGRLGLLNYPLYALVRNGQAYGPGADAPLRDIVRGDTWYYRAGPGYDQTTGVGTLNVDNFAKALVRMAAEARPR